MAAKELDTNQNTKIIIKEEKIDLEIESKLSSINIKIKKEIDVSPTSEQLEELNDNDGINSSDTDNNTDSDKEVDKKSIVPAKSSNEILAELFSVFNAAPPEELLNDENLLKKSKKSKKHKKEKKRKHRKASDASAESDISADGNKLANGKHKHKKRKKHKHKDDKYKDKIKEKHRRDNVKDGMKETNLEKNVNIKEEPVEEEQAGSSKKPKLQTNSEEHSKSKKVSKNEHSSHHANSDYRERGKSTRETRERTHQKDTTIKTEPVENNVKNAEQNGHISEISLSDEETYLRERQHVNDKLSVKNNRSRNDFFKGYDRRRNRDHYNRRDSRSARHNYSRSRSRSRSRDLGIDKKRLLEIARKNAISMFKRGNLPGADNMSEEIKDKVLLKMRYGGRTVQDLTDFCKKISNGENLSDLSSEEDSDVDKNGNTKAFHHPFELKEREPIVMHIRNANTTVPRNTNEDSTKAITMQFPVSSGQQHRLKETWVPVEAKDKLVPLPTLPSVTQSTNIFKNVKKNVFEKPVPHAEQEPAFISTSIPTSNAIEPSKVPTTNAVAIIAPVSKPINNVPNYLPPLPIFNTTTAPPTQIVTPFVPDVPVPSANTTAFHDSVFPQPPLEPLDVSAIVTKRLTAMRRLQDNPKDPEALNMMYSSQKEMLSWASSKHMPGQFTGSTGANILKAHELHTGPQVWARRDQLISTQPVTGGMGMHLLQKMGWKPGEGLGREKTGSLQPLLLDVKLDKRGLVSKEDNSGARRLPPSKKQKCNNIAQAQNNIQNKHPVCLLNEVTSKRKWTPPLYTLVSEHGPPHSRMFMYSVQVNGQSFKPEKASNTKKEAKMYAAKFCLQEFGLLPRDDV